MTMRDIGRTLDDGADAAHDLEHAANVRAVRGGDMEHDSAGSRGARCPDEADNAESANSTEIENGAGAVTRG